MLLKKTFDKQEEIPAGFESLYTEKDGKWVRDDTLIEAPPAAAPSDASTKIATLTKNLEKERNDHKTTKAALKGFEGLNAEDVRTSLSELETMRLQIENGDIKPGDPKIKEHVEAKLKGAVAPLNRKIEEMQRTIDTLNGENTGLKTEKRSGRIVADVLAAATAAKVVESARDDIATLAPGTFEINEAGETVTREGLRGVASGLSPKEYFDDMKERRAHWWPPSQGGGALGGGGGTPSAKWGEMNMTERSLFIRQHGMQKADVAAKAAGFESALAPEAKRKPAGAAA